MTEVIYSGSRVANAGGRKALNPKFFVAPIEGVKKVYLNGEYPNIAAAYREQGAVIAKISDLPAAKSPDAKKGAE